jgi:hypothetical protein
LEFIFFSIKRHFKKLAVSSAVVMHFLKRFTAKCFNMYKIIQCVHEFNFDLQINQTVKISRRVTEINLSAKQVKGLQKDIKFQWVCLTAGLWKLCEECYNNQPNTCGV